VARGAGWPASPATLVPKFRLHAYELQADDVHPAVPPLIHPGVPRTIPGYGVRHSQPLTEQAIPLGDARRFGDPPPLPLFRRHLRTGSGTMSAGAAPVMMAPAAAPEPSITSLSIGRAAVSAGSQSGATDHHGLQIRRDGRRFGCLGCGLPARTPRRGGTAKRARSQSLNLPTASCVTTSRSTASRGPRTNIGVR